MSRVTRNLQLLLRSERVLAETQVRLASRKLALMAGAGIACLLALAMLNVAGYFALLPSLGNAGAALAVGLADAVVGGILATIASLLQAGPEEDMVREVRDMAVAELGAELEQVQARLVEMGQGVETVRSNVASFVQSPLDALLPHLIGPAVSAVTSLAKTRKKPREAKG